MSAVPAIVQPLLSLLQLPAERVDIIVEVKHEIFVPNAMAGGADRA